MTISEIYTQYKIMPNLQLHMLRVAGVAKIICENMQVEVDSQNIVTACLLHDMGNIIKFKLGYIPSSVEPEGLEYWREVKDDFILKYGNDEHEATKMIIKEIGISDRVAEIVNAVGFSKSLENLLHNDFGKKIACYSDHRVKPDGIASLEDRMKDGMQRFISNKNILRVDKDKFLKEHEMYAKGMRELEQEIFVKCNLKPKDINDNNIEITIDKLKDFEIQKT